MDRYLKEFLQAHDTFVKKYYIKNWGDEYYKLPNYGHIQIDTFYQRCRLFERYLNYWENKLHLPTYLTDASGKELHLFDIILYPGRSDFGIKNKITRKQWLSSCVPMVIIGFNTSEQLRLEVIGGNKNYSFSPNGFYKEKIRKIEIDNLTKLEKIQYKKIIKEYGYTGN